MLWIGPFAKKKRPVFNVSLEKIIPYIKEESAILHKATDAKNHLNGVSTLKIAIPFSNLQSFPGINCFNKPKGQNFLLG